MRFRISHQISYVYSSPVFPEPHILRLRPRSDASQQITEFSMVLEPQPTGRHDFLDAENNGASCLWFTDKISSLDISTSFTAHTSGVNPFSYLVTDDAFFQLPGRYTGSDAAALAPYLAADAAAAAAAAAGIGTFTTTLVNKAAGNTLDFLALLNTALYENFTVTIRDQGDPLPPMETLQKQEGACRDLAVLFMAACRHVGLAVRFVSGYQEGDQDTPHRHLHAWVEVYIPGGGWRGYDPTLGLVVADRHIALAASHHPAGAAPVSGTFRGTGVTTTMSFHIDLMATSD